jgi:S-adenosylhomocysteine hydrolase
MIFKLFVTEEATCNERAVVDLINELQLFFSFEQPGPRLKLPTEIAANLLLSPQLLRESLKKHGLIADPPQGLSQILFTSRQVSGNKEAEIFADAEPPLISNYFTGDLEPARSLRLTRHLLHVGMSRIKDPRCTEETCVCGPDQDFICLCGACEQALQESGYRDGLYHLKDSINWLNQRYGRESPDLNKLPTTRSQARLPLADYYATQISTEGSTPFKGKTILMVLHFLSDLVPFVRAMAKLGADHRNITLIAKPYPYSRRDHVCHELETMGVRVFRADKKTPVKHHASAVLSGLKSGPALKDRTFVVIEDGGYFGPLLHSEEFSSLLAHCHGVVEQTTKGIRAYEKLQVTEIPVLSVAKCQFKDQYESPEIGRVTVQNIGRFVPNVKLSGRRALVFGFGAIGEHVVYHLNRTFNMGVCVIDIDPYKRLKATHRKDIVSEVYASFGDLPAPFLKMVRLVVGTTGWPVITGEIMKQLPNECILVSTSSDRDEIDMDALAELAGKNQKKIEEGKTEYTLGTAHKPTTLTVLADGYPINFYASESLPNDSIDPIMTMLLLCGVEVCRCEFPPGPLEKEVNKIEKKHHLTEEFLKRC